MQISPDTLKFLRCPDSGDPLEFLEQAGVDRLNQAIGDKKLTNRIGKTVEAKLDAALINASRSWVYSIREGIVSMILDEAISANSLETPRKLT